MPNKSKPQRQDRARSASERRGRGSALDLLCVIDRLEIGPVRINKKRLVCPYTVVRDGNEDATFLIYSYQEDVFAPEDASSQNLANMIAAQVALNYGLFCEKIVFRGAFDAADRNFLREMARNTAREIYVKKFLEPNPLIVGDAADLPVVHKQSYLRAELIFPDSEERGEAVCWGPAETDHNRVGVSSSGGKDSLLSYGLLRDLGCDVHPIFGNESGRHWFTALNSYRHFEKNIPNTARVWMNSDRLFAWMLRHLPFVSPNFARVRSDEYPIRLWTVAVFLFGALPIMRKRGVGRLVVGDEYDTTTRVSHKGITHYDGLFDQSRYFDNFLSRYYHRKSWQLSQFSIVRPLSELLIQSVLVKRYPNLFKLQVSCHATHKDAERVRPCGACEKCRRIVGMVMASGGDPSDCGYTDEQIEKCLVALAEKGIHQERDGREHLMWTLHRDGKLPSTRGASVKMKEHRAILQLRFDRERAPLDGVPREFRESLYRILLEYTNGAVRRQGRMWSEMDIWADPALHSPYLFDRSKKFMAKAKKPVERRHRHILAEMTWPEAQRRLKEVDVAILPVGAIEQHGPHLPLDTDAFDADYLAKAVAEGCSDPKPIVLPLIPYGVSYHHDEFSGTISIDNDTLRRIVFDVGMSAAKNGVSKLVIINGHGGNAPALNFAAQMINRHARIFVCVDTGESSDVDIYSMIDTPNDVHAGEIETSTSLAIRPELVNMENAESLVPRFSNRYLNFTSKRAIPWYAFTKKISKSGVMGDPTKATAEKGQKMWDVMIEHLVAFVEDLKQLTVDEIFEKRY